MVLRSDEKANEAEVERDQRFRSNAGKIASTAIAAGTAAVSGPLAARIMPFLNQYIPAALAMKGISKVSPRLGSFLQKGQEMGLDIEQGLDFLKEKFEGKEPTKNPKEEKNVIEQYDPELHTYIKMKLGEGLNLLEAGKKALGHSRFKNAVDKLTKDHKTSWDTILKNVYGHSEKGQSQEQQQPDQRQEMQQDQEMQAQQGQQPQGQPGQGQAALMGMLNKLMQARGVK